MKLMKKITSVCICMVLLAGLTACEEEQSWIFSINGQELYNQEITILGLMFTMDYGIKNSEQLKEAYEEEKTYSEYYKKQLEKEIIDIIILYQEAEQNHYQLSEKEEENIKTKTDQFLDYYGKDWLSESGIKREDVEPIYKLRVTGDSYLKSISTENAQNDKNERFVKVFQVIFPTVELDEDGMVKSGTDGEVTHISDIKKEQKKTEAQGFCERAKAGEDIVTLLKDYDNTVTGIERYIQYSELDTEYKKAVEGLAEGEISDVITSDYGYYVVKLLEKNATEYARTLSVYEDNKQGKTVREDVLSDLYDNYIRGQREYKNDSEWDKVSLELYIK
ncbi:MAG: peptidyl-prolyl cis-trans isomerase [Lachnospiraceae bacterium]|nr:peptidyl-prolyl cis-trans isomerase [Lachnospiraceae bacterium]